MLHVCSICGREFVQMCIFLHHIRKSFCGFHEPTIIPYSCLICCRSFRHWLEVLRHVRKCSIQQPMKDPCKMCAVMFYNKFNLLRYIRIHRYSNNIVNKVMKLTALDDDNDESDSYRNRKISNAYHYLLSSRAKSIA